MYTGGVDGHGPYTAVYGPCIRQVGLPAMYTTGRVRGRVPGPCTRTFTEPCAGRVHGPCIRPVHGSVHGRVHGPSCTWQVGLQGHIHVPRRHATAVCGPLRHTVRVCGRVHGPCRRTCTRLCMGRVHDRVHGALRPCTWPKAATCRLGPCTRTCTWRVYGLSTAV